MKLLAFLSCLFISSLLVAEEHIPVKSTIHKVTVFTKGAQVSRMANVPLNPGKQTLLFTGLTANLDKNSIQLKADGDLTVLSVTHQLNYLEAPDIEEELKTLREQVAVLKDSIEEQQVLINVYSEEADLILSNKKIGGQQNGVDLNELRNTADFYRNRLQEIKFAKLNLGRSIKSLTQRVFKIEQQIDAQLNKKGTTTSELIVVLDVKSQTNTKVLLGYLVYNAGWYATYDARVKDVDNPLQLAYKANVYQTSGEDWPNVALTLSTGNPIQNSVRPDLLPWQLKFIIPSVVTIRGSRSDATNYYIDGIKVRPSSSLDAVDADKEYVEGIVLDESGEPLIGANILIKGTNVGTSTDFDGKYRLDIPPGGNTLVISYTGYNTLETAISSSNMNLVLQEGSMLSEIVVTRSSKRRRKKSSKKDEVITPQPVASNTLEQATTIEFQITLPYTVKTDGKKQLVHIQDHEISSSYQYYTTPKLDPHAYLTANLTNWEQYNLLSGEANLFFEGTYLGRSFLDVENTDDTLSLSLGQDRNIVISRTKEKEYSDRKFLSNKKIDSRNWKIEVRNKKKTSINLIIEDQFPLSTNDEIEVSHKSYQGASLEKETGLLQWQLELAPSEQKAVEFAYEVKYPKKKVIKLE